MLILQYLYWIHAQLANKTNHLPRIYFCWLKDRGNEYSSSLWSFYYRKPAVTEFQFSYYFFNTKELWQCHIIKRVEMKFLFSHIEKYDQQ